MTAAAIAPLAVVSACASGPATQGSASNPRQASSAASSPAASSPPASSPAAGGSGPPVAVGGAPNIPVVRLGSRFTPSTLRLGTGQHFEVIVSRGVKPTGSGISGPCTPTAAARFSTAMLSLSCTGGAYLYTARQAGTTTLSVSVRPSCAAGAMCPQWMTVARLTLKIS